MNRPGPVPQSLRGMPNSFGAQQPQQPGRGAVSNRLPNGKLAGNGSGWAFGGGVPLGNGGLQNPGRQLVGNASFAQSLSGSQPATPLDLSEFPSLSNSSQLSGNNPSAMWSAAGSRSLAGAVPRGQGTPLPSQPTPQEELYNSSSRMPSAQGSFRFGNPNVTQGQATAGDEFPPLGRNANGEIGQERASNLMASLGLNTQGTVSSASMPASRTGNGLLNALSANTRTADVRSPTAVTRPQDSRGTIGDSESRQKDSTFRDEGMASQTPFPDGTNPGTENRNPLGAIGNEAPASKAKDSSTNLGTDVQDPLAGMAPIDKFGLKGLRTLINNYPDYNALIVGIDPSSFGLDLSTTELISKQIYSPFDDTPPRPAIPKYRLPECYQVNNVQPIESKIQSFNEETLMWIFYSCPGDIKQHLAAIELNSRGWRWHKKLQIWLTKDEVMVPQVLSPNHERGYYVIWDTVNWRKERREFTLHYADLDTNPA
ncbi:hypothetical protein VTK73DRAFT_7095 [Phialemonium thermophilum]|uniref:NOT2/NOT3/NOT5 C-terminal domain-containing protein n=1 Tax=Phialemonium thermophilum TaxID=223376 RepID=A0ABR3XUW8_9PEZI